MALTIWISTFIPNDIPGLTQPVPRQTNKTMIPGPLPTSDCYHTDHRSFSGDPTKSARARSRVDISERDLTLLNQEHHCGFTVECDCEDGDVECREKASTAGLKVKNFQAGANACTFTFEGGAGNPCVTMAPEINWLVNVEVKKVAGGKLQVSALAGSKIEPFPAFEMYATFNGTTRAIFREGPAPGTTPWDLVGGPTRGVSGTVVL